MFNECEYNMFPAVKTSEEKAKLENMRKIKRIQKNIDWHKNEIEWHKKELIIAKDVLKDLKRK